MINHCPECENKVEIGQKHCAECGHDLKKFWKEEKEVKEHKKGKEEGIIEKTEHKIEKAVGKGTNWKLIGGIAVVILIVVTGFVYAATTTKTVPYTQNETYNEKEPVTVQECKDANVPYTTQECKAVQVPYTDNVCKNVQVPYNSQDCQNKQLPYKVDQTECSQKGWFSPAKVTYTVTNLDTETGGSFGFWVGFYLSDGNKVGQAQQQYIYPQQSASFTYSTDAPISSCTYSANSIPTKSVCQNVVKYKTEQQCTPETKYRTEQQCSDVTKVRTESQCEDVTKYQQATKTRAVNKYKEVPVVPQIYNLFH